MCNLRDGSKIRSPYVFKIPGLLGVFENSLGEVILQRSLIKSSKTIIPLSIGIIVLCFFSAVNAKTFNAGIQLSDDQGNILYNQNKNLNYIPASILKILTSLVAIHTLGETYQFPTIYAYDDSSKNLYIKGFGDPLFISEVIQQFCKKLSTQIKSVNHIIVDQSYYSDRIDIPGTGHSLNPYDATVGALCANFNTVNFRWDEKENRYTSGEPQTPLLSIFLDEIAKTEAREGRILLSKKQRHLYPGFLIKHFLIDNGVSITGSVSNREFKPSPHTQKIFLSPYKLTEVIQKLLKYSNNFMANQILLSMGAHVYGEPATLEKGLRVIKDYSTEHLKLDNIEIAEGSGLSRSNHISPENMSKVLYEFIPYAYLLRQKGNDLYKTGTLTNVRTRAGYLIGMNSKLYPYVIMVNKKETGYEDILNQLQKIVFQR